MREIKATVEVLLTVEEVHEVNELVRRNRPKPMGKHFWRGEFKNDPPADECGVCGKVISTDDWVFCPVCGNRIDRENYKLEGGE